MPYTKVVIIGGGFGGLNAAKALKKARLELLLIDKTNHHLFQPLLYQVATAALSPGEIAIPIREVLRNQANTSVIMGEVVHIDKKARKVHLQNGDEVGYDYLIIATGARHSYFGNDAWEAFAPGLKTMQDALKIREQVLISFEKAERMDRISDAEKYLNFVVIGGGPTGVEMAGAIAEIAHKTMFRNFRRIRPEKSKIYLVEALPYILSTYPKKLSIRARKDLKKMGVKVITEKKVTSITAEGVQIEDEFIPCVNVVWAAGNQVSPLMKTLDVPLDRAGRVIVEPDLSIPEHPEVFVIGDAALAMGKGDKPLPGIAPTAIQQSSYVAKLIKKEIPKEKRRPFKYFDKGSMATIGTKKAVAVMGKFHLSGFLAWAAWCFIHIAYLIGFRNRFGVMVEWFYCFMTGRARGTPNLSLDRERAFQANKMSSPALFWALHFAIGCAFIFHPHWVYLIPIACLALFPKRKLQNWAFLIVGLCFAFIRYPSLDIAEIQGNGIFSLESISPYQSPFHRSYALKGTFITFSSNGQFYSHIPLCHFSKSSSKIRS